MYPRVKEIAGRQYVYLVEGVRTGRKVRQSTVAYLGPLLSLTSGIPAPLRKKAERRARAPIDWEAVRRKIAQIPVNFDDVAGRQTDSIRARNMFRRSFVQKRAYVTKTPRELLLQRAPSELEALTRLAKRGFDSMFQQVGPYEYKLRTMQR